MIRRPAPVRAVLLPWLLVCAVGDRASDEVSGHVASALSVDARARAAVVRPAEPRRPGERVWEPLQGGASSELQRSLESLVDEKARLNEQVSTDEKEFTSIQERLDANGKRRTALQALAGRLKAGKVETVESLARTLKDPRLGLNRRHQDGRGKAEFLERGNNKSRSSLLQGRGRAAEDPDSYEPLEAAGDQIDAQYAHLQDRLFKIRQQNEADSWEKQTIEAKLAEAQRQLDMLLKQLDILTTGKEASKLAMLKTLEAVGDQAIPSASQDQEGSGGQGDWVLDGVEHHGGDEQPVVQDQEGSGGQGDWVLDGVEHHGGDEQPVAQDDGANKDQENSGGQGAFLVDGVEHHGGDEHPVAQDDGANKEPEKPVAQHDDADHPAADHNTGQEGGEVPADHLLDGDKAGHEGGEVQADHLLDGDKAGQEGAEENADHAVDDHEADTTNDGNPEESGGASDADPNENADTNAEQSNAGLEDPNKEEDEEALLQETLARGPKDPEFYHALRESAEAVDLHFNMLTKEAEKIRLQMAKYQAELDRLNERLRDNQKEEAQLKEQVAKMKQGKKVFQEELRKTMEKTANEQIRMAAEAPQSTFAGMRVQPGSQKDSQQHPDSPKSNLPVAHEIKKDEDGKK